MWLVAGVKLRYRRYLDIVMTAWAGAKLLSITFRSGSQSRARTCGSRPEVEQNLTRHFTDIPSSTYILDRKIFLNITTGHLLHSEPLREEVEGVEQEAGAVPDGCVRPEPLLGPQRRGQPPHGRGHCRETGLASRDMQQSGHLCVWLAPPRTPRSCPRSKHCL